MTFFQPFVQYCIEHCPKGETYRIWWPHAQYCGFSHFGGSKKTFLNRKKWPKMAFFTFLFNIVLNIVQKLKPTKFGVSISNMADFQFWGFQKNLKKKAKSSAISYESQNSQKINIKQHVHVITPYLGILKRILTCPSFKRWLVQSIKNDTGQAKVEKPKKCKKNYFSLVCWDTCL